MSVTQQRAAAGACCGHEHRRHVRSSTGRCYCIERGCRCSDFTPMTKAVIDVIEDERVPVGVIAVAPRVVAVPEVTLKPVWSASICRECGGSMVRTGACETCTQCGSNTGCG